MDFVFEYLFLYCVCATAGWCLEVVYRGIRHRKVVNPGFLTGCCLPIYGIGGALLYFLSGLKLRTLPNEPLRVAVILLMAMAIMTLIELVGGAIAVKCFHVRLWDYSGEWKNFKGLICPKFSLFWGIICAGFYFGLYMPLHSYVEAVVESPFLILAVGMYLGIFLVDLVRSLKLLQHIKHYAKAMRTLVHMDQLKSNAREHFRQEVGGKRPFHFYGMVSRYMTDVYGYRRQIHQKWGERNDAEKK
ncbi:MAG: putative ABC transporter permease [Clostridia bacterium]|nr:putative ABC transporter permease [Clostridia bacterium]